MPEVRVAMVGAGFAADFHTRCFRQIVGASAPVVAVTSQRRASAEAFAARMGVPAVYDTLGGLLADEAVDVVDLCVPTANHIPLALEAVRAGKHVIIEKPLTGYCGEADTPEGALIGDTVERSHMQARVLEDMALLEEAIQAAGVRMMYAENWVYAPTVQKARRLITAGGGTILRMVAEESHSGSHAAYAKYWRLAGGGSLLRTGSHPVGGVLYLKQAEGLARNGKPIRPKSVVAETGLLTRIESFQAEPEKYLKTGLEDCEDWGSAIITFEDGSVAEVASSDVVLGGVYNHIEIFASQGRIQCHMNPNNQCVAYGPAESAFGEEYVAEKISTRAGWSFASPDEHWASGYPQEIQDFVECIVEGREPLSGWLLARDVVATIFAAYVSAWEGRRAEVL